MNLIHYSQLPLSTIEPREQLSRNREYCSCYEKPKGFWLSVQGEDDWLSWCIANEFRSDRLIYETPVELVGKPHIITSPWEFDKFTDEFGFAFRWGKDLRWTDWCIDWEEVAKRFPGLIIAPYLWERRLGDRHWSWYYNWDCASGCIWDPSAIRLGESRKRLVAAA